MTDTTTAAHRTDDHDDHDGHHDRDDQNPVPELPLLDLAGFTHQWVDADGVRLHVVQGGRSTGPALVLLAGFPQTWWAWHKAMPRLAERFRVIAIDLPGQGHSERPQGGYDTHTVAARIQAAVAGLDVPKYWLAAHDIGSSVAFSLALKYPERLHGVALLDAGIPGITLPDAVPTDPERVWKTWHLAFHQVAELPEILLAGREREYVSWFLAAKTLSPAAFDDAEIDHYAAGVAADGGLRASLAYYREAPESARRNHEALGRGHLTVPILGVSSSHGSIPDMGAALSAWADDVTGIIIPQAGHFIPDEQPDAVVDALTAFIDSERVG